MSQLFDKIKVGSVKSSTFDLSHNQITTSDFGYLVPICYRDMVPNDDFTVKHDLFTRLAPLAVPTFTPSPIKVRVHNFFVPYRILFPHWDAFITQDPNNNYIPPYLTGSDIDQWVSRDKAYYSTSSSHRLQYTRLMTNLGLNPRTFTNQEAFLEDVRFSMFPFLAYYRIWLDWFMDSSIEDHTAKVAAFNEMIKDGGDLHAYADELCLTRNACFKKDYFTTARQSPQSGDASKVAVDIAGTDLNSVLWGTGTTPTPIYKIPNSSNVGISSPQTGSSVIGQFTIEALRAANSLQKWLEKNNFVGTKLINRMFAHFGIAPSPERLDMSEFIGGSEFPIEIGDVTSTSFQQGEDDYMGLGAQSGKGWGRGRSNSVTYHAKEHGVFMSLMSILPDTGYYQGISRFWQKGVTGEPLDYFTPEFENLGFQEVLNKELFVPFDTDTQYNDYQPDGIFAFQPRYAEYKFQQDILAADFLTSVNTPTGFNLDSWHLFRKFNFDNDNPIALNKNLVECDNHNNDFDRIFQSTDNEYDHFYFMIKSDVEATRPMDGFAAPSLDNANEGDGKMVNLPYGGTRL